MCTCLSTLLHSNILPASYRYLLNVILSQSFYCLMYNLTASTATTTFSIKLYPEIQVAEIQENVTFTCRIISNHPFNVDARWYDQTNTLLDSSDLTEDDDILSLLVTIENETDYQDYICAVSDSDNNTITATAILGELMYV